MCISKSKLISIKIIKLFIFTAERKNYDISETFFTILFNAQ